MQRLFSLPALAEFTYQIDVTDKDWTSSQFTALSNVYIVHKSIQVELWNFKDLGYEKIPQQHMTLDVETSNITYKKRLNMTLEDPNIKKIKAPARKGLLYARFRLNGTKKLDLANVHLFHDEDNMVAMKSTPSIFSQNRMLALQNVLEICQPEGSELAPFFVFGDFNFRLDLSGVLESIAKDAAGKHVQTKDGDQSKITFSAKDGTDLLVMGPKSFTCANSIFLANNGETFLQYDFEAEEFDELHELPRHFPPSYAYAEDIALPTSLLPKRCPAWCDRVLMSASGHETAREGSYSMLGQDVCTGDHKPIALTFCQ
jgi:inositol-1,4,5-trisphosphate 5-phosphatase